MALLWAWSFKWRSGEHSQLAFKMCFNDEEEKQDSFKKLSYSQSLPIVKLMSLDCVNSLEWSCDLIVWGRVVLRRTVVGISVWSFQNLSRSHPRVNNQQKSFSGLPYPNYWTARSQVTPGFKPSAVFEKVLVNWLKKFIISLVGRWRCVGFNKWCFNHYNFVTIGTSLYWSLFTGFIWDILQTVLF